MPKNIDKTVVMVTGMHRSGTSAVARMLSLLGIALPRRLMRPWVDNKTGFWEPEQIVAIHKELLASAGSRRDDVTQCPQAWYTSEVCEEYKARLLQALEADYADA